MDLEPSFLIDYTEVRSSLLLFTLGSARGYIINFEVLLECFKKHFDKCGRVKYEL